MTDPSKQAVPADKAANNGFAGSRRECVDLLSVKAKEWAEARKKDGPLQLLDLPLDILKCIMKEVCPMSQLDHCFRLT